MEPPSSRIHIQYLVPTVARISFELDFRNAVEVDGLEETLTEFFYFRQIDGLNISGRSSKLSGMLSHALCYEAAMRSAIPEKRAIGDLAVTVAGNDFLNHNFAGFDLSRSRAEQFPQLLGSIGTPSFCSGRVEEVLLNGWFDGQRQLGIKRRKFVDTLKRPGPRRGNSKVLGQPIGVSLIPGPTRGVPHRSGYSEELRQPLTMK